MSLWSASDCVRRIIPSVVSFRPVVAGLIGNSEKVKTGTRGGFAGQKVPDRHRNCERRRGETLFMGLSEGEDQPIGGNHFDRSPNGWTNRQMAENYLL
jgi:hypothetical protein